MHTCRAVAVAMAMRFELDTRECENLVRLYRKGEDSAVGLCFLSSAFRLSSVLSEVKRRTLFVISQISGNWQTLKLVFLKIHWKSNTNIQVNVIISFFYGVAFSLFFFSFLLASCPSLFYLFQVTFLFFFLFSFLSVLFYNFNT